MATVNTDGWVRKCTYLPDDAWEWIDRQSYAEGVDRATFLFSIIEAERDRRRMMA